MQLTEAAHTGLPGPDADGLRHSERVCEFLRHAIDAAGGSISFAEYMQHVLYAPGLGYYVAGTRKFGPGGDFVTAPELSPLFARVLARQIAGIFDATGDASLLELGAGDGTLMIQLLQALRDIDALPEQYRILDVSPDLRERQRQRLQQALPGFVSRVNWLDRLPAGFDGIVVANEVADALPVERFVRTRDGVCQIRVAVHADGFELRREPAPSFLERAVLSLEERLGRQLPAGYVSELSCGLPGWIGDIAASLGRAFVFLFDYGVAAHEYYAPDRYDGWLRCHYRHRAHDDPLYFPGLQDLTAWVDFTAVADAAVAAGLDVAGYVTQSHFLLDGGLADELAGLADADPATQLELSRQVKLLTLPGEMGEHFKCLGLCRGNVAMPAAFARHDRSHTL